MKKLFLFATLLLLCLGLHAQNTNPTSREGLQISPDTLHLYFYGCSPHLEYVSVINPSDEFVIIYRVYAEHFQVDCLLNGNNIADVGTYLFPHDTLHFNIYAYPYEGKDHYGDLIFSTDIGDFPVVIFYEDNVSVAEDRQQTLLYPNPANDFITVKGENLGKVSVFNALGQLVETFYTEENTLRIPTAHYPDGVYLLITNQQEKRRFVVSH